MKLIDYYRELIDLNDSQKGGWAKFYYGVFSKIVEENNYKTIAEIGIGLGGHAKEILKNTTVDKLFLIDPMVFYPNDQFADDIMRQEPLVSGNNFNELYDLINHELSPWKERYTWFRKPSLSITNDEIPNESLDCIFVDGDHSYHAVINDLRFWWAKLKVGGKMLGDDYWMGDVKRAVHEFANEIHIEPVFYTRPDNDYKIFCFSK